MSYHYVIVDNLNNKIWESENQENQLEDFEIALDIIVADYFRRYYSAIKIPDNLLYADFILGDSKENFPLQLFSFDFNKKEMKSVVNSMELKNYQGENKTISNKIKILNEHISNEYEELLEFSKNIIKEIKAKEVIQKIHIIANKKNQFSKAALFVLGKIYNTPVSEEDLISHYGSIDKTVNYIGHILMNVKDKEQQTDV